MKAKPASILLISVLVLIAAGLAACNIPLQALPVKAQSENATPTATPPPVVEEHALGDASDEMGETTPLGSDGGELIYVPGGEFLMGSVFDDPLAYPEETPKHPVYIDGFWLHKNEVTNEMYAVCVEDGPCTAPNTDERGPFEEHPYFDPAYNKHPVVDVTWYQAATYCEWVNGRLPTEAEWERAARGVEGITYPWGETAPDCSLANLEGCQTEADKEGTHEIGVHVPGLSPAEALDMAGNVREWTFDFYTDTYYGLSPYYNPPGPREGELRVARGGGWQDSERHIRTTQRYPLEPGFSGADLGFRCVVLAEATQASYCQLSYAPLCAPTSFGSPGYQPGLPNFGVPTPPGDPENITFEFGCTDNGATDLTLNMRRITSENDLVTVNGNPYNCETNSDYPDRLFCSGAAAPQGQDISITICGEGGQDIPCPPGYTYDTGMETCLPPSGGDGSDDCPEGYFFDTGTETCQLYQDGGSDTQCPTGYYYDTGLEQCVPYDGGDDTDCPDGYYYDTGLETCIPYSGGDGSDNCPLGYYYDTGMEQCVSTGDECPLGTYFDTQTEQCIPTGDECPYGYYFDTQTEQCIPTDGGQCYFGFYYDPYQEQCIPTTTVQRCGEGSYFNTQLNCCVPFGNNMGCEEGYQYDVELGYCSPQPGENGDCPEGYYYDTGFESCRSSGDENTNCPEGYYFDTLLNTCQPSNSGFNTGYPPGTDCPPGTYVDQYTGACTPDTTTETGEDCPQGYYFDTNSERCLSTGDSCPLGFYFDNATEQCLPTTGELSGCPVGYYYNDWYACCTPSYDGGREGCPEGFYYDTGLGYCTPPPGDGGDCPEGYYFDTQYERCFSTGDGDGQTRCPAGQVFDTGLGYCTPAPGGDGDCPEGYYYDTGFETCVPSGDDNPGGGDRCPDGYFYDTGLESCVPGSQGQRSSCVTITWRTGYCPTPTPPTCGQGEVWNNTMNECVQREDRVDDPPKCSDFSISECGVGNGCYWDTGTNSCQGTP